MELSELSPEFATLELSELSPEFATPEFAEFGLPPALCAMRILVILSCLLISPFTMAVECEPVLNNLVKILKSKGALAVDKSVYPSKLKFADFGSSCKTTLDGSEYTLFLHRDEVTIVIELVDTNSGQAHIKGPFYSAYRK